MTSVPDPHEDVGPPDAEDDRWFRLLAEVSHTAIMVMREKFLYVNPATERLLGYTAEELAQIEPPQVVHPDFREEAARRYRARLHGEPVPDRYEMKLLHKDGSERWIDYSAALVVQEGQRAILAEGTDITESKKAKEALMASERCLRLVIEGTSGVTGGEFFQAVTRSLSETFQVRAAFAAELDREKGEAELLSLWRDGRPARVERWSLGDAWPSGPGLWSSAVGPPEAEPGLMKDFLTELAAESYRIAVFADSAGAPMGLLGIAGDGEAVAAASEPLLQILASRAAAELARMRTEEALSREKEYAQVTLSSIGDGVIRTDAQGRIDFMNPLASWLLGWRSGEAQGRPIQEVYRTVGESSGREKDDPVAACLERKRLIVDPAPKLVVRRTDGAEFAVRDSAAPIRDLQGRIVGSVLVFKDVTELRGMEREVRFMESHDSLTGLFNRSRFERSVEAALAQPGSPGHVVCYLDLDDFKLINDALGNDAADQVLKMVGHLLKARTRDGDVVARLGSDEFGVLFEDCPRELARSLVDDFRRALKEQDFHWQDRSLECTVSIGLVPLTDRFRSVAQVLSVAHGACFLAQQEGRHRVYEYRSGDTAVTERLDEMQWIHRIQQAFAEDRFLLYRQPFAALGENLEPISEIFLRMVGEDGEILTPGAFIQAAERYRLVSTIDRWVVEKALQLLGANPEAFEGIFTINLSAQSLTEEGFLEDVAGLLEASSVDPSLICFEITETAAIANLDAALAFFHELRRRGCRFLLDDFGSGMSSLAYLKNLPVDYLKIDGEFVRHIAWEPVQRAMVESIQRISSVLGIRTIGECVEAEATLEVLRTIGIDYAQGFWLGEPVPMEPARKPALEPGGSLPPDSLPPDSLRPDSLRAGEGRPPGSRR